MRAARVYIRFPGEVSKAVTLSYDDGSEQDIRLISILNSHGMKGTFNISSGLYSPEGNTFKEGSVCRRLSQKACIELYKNSGHEVAVHGYSHPMLEQMPSSRVVLEVLEDRLNLEKDYGVPIRGMAYPFGSYSQSVVDTLKSAGIAYSRLTSPTRNFNLPQDWLRLEPTCKHTDGQLTELIERFVASKGERAAKLFYLWGHSFEFESDNNWDVIERFCESIGGRDDTWYATNIEIYDYTKAYERLIWMADMSGVYNPSVTPVSFMYHTLDASGEERRLYTVRGGETLLIP